MKTQVILALVATSFGAPHTGEASMSLVKREEMAASCLKMLCCKNKKRHLENVEGEAEAQCLVCWKFGICSTPVREGSKDQIGKVSAEIDQNIVHNQDNFQDGGFWIRRGGREYWVGNNGKYWEWMGGDHDKSRGQFRLGGDGEIKRAQNGKWYYTFLD
ncbi:hypothetical protein L249_6597 [Ophiocordyceps polyrhachis-furcata BCC 54312]|uniref:Uncharacterized protein n=1 Tax=Ophiocordyceps polyrhachis-furcata BCC 54312 TaxID=1330021 RepID=A0A367LKZ3_9HYPO|nr:hypothetical protein L249_6597 [Ophiocordyceps polyrhachis-furcata BCC 54312]